MYCHWKTAVSTYYACQNYPCSGTLYAMKHIYIWTHGKERHSVSLLSSKAVFLHKGCWSLHNVSNVLHRYYPKYEFLVRQIKFSNTYTDVWGQILCAELGKQRRMTLWWFWSRSLRQVRERESELWVPCVCVHEFTSLGLNGPSVSSQYCSPCCKRNTIIFTDTE